MSSNPYSDEQPSPYAFQSQLATGSVDGDGYVKQIAIVGTLTLVQASLELLMSVFLLLGSIFMFAMRNSPSIQQMPNPAPMQLISYGYAIIASIVLVSAIVRLIAGVMILRRRSRVYCIVATVLGLASVFSCYCSLTSVGLCIYALIVLFQPSVIAAFEKNDKLASI